MTSTARRVGTDAISPAFAQLLPMAFPNAELVDGELPCARPADQDARRGGGDARGHCGSPKPAWPLRSPSCGPGVTEQTLAGVVLEAMAAGGVSTPSTQDAAWVTSRDHPWRRAAVTGGSSRRPGGVLRRGAGRRIRRGGRPYLAGRRARAAPPSCTSVRMAVDQADRRVPAGGAGQLTCSPPTTAAGEPAAADAGRPRAGTGLRPAGGLAAASRDRRRRTTGPGDGARGHRLRLAARTSARYSGGRRS